MGLDTLWGYVVGTSDTLAVLYCTTTMRALPFMFRSAEDADDFIQVHAHLGDFRSLPLPQQEKLFDAWQAEWLADPDAERHPRAVRELTTTDENADAEVG